MPEEELQKQPQKTVVDDKKSVLKNAFSFVGFLLRAVFVYLAGMLIIGGIGKNFFPTETHFDLSGPRILIYRAFQLIGINLPLLFSAASLPRFRRSICCVLAFPYWSFILLCVVYLLIQSFRQNTDNTALYIDVDWRGISALALSNLLVMWVVWSDSRLSRFKEIAYDLTPVNKTETNAEAIVNKLNALGVNLELQDEKINFAPKSKVTPEMLSQMKEHRDGLVELLVEKERKATALIKYGSFSRGRYIVTMLLLVVGLAWFYEDVVAEFGTTYFYFLCTGVFLIPVFLRVKNIGYDKRWFFLVLIPVVSILVLIDCAFRPEGYADRKPAT